MRSLNAALVFLVLTLVARPAAAYFNQLDELLAAHVKPTTEDGIRYNGVDYSAWGQDARYIPVRDAILATDPDTLSSRNEKLAFWINAYNVLTIDLIVRENERDTIKNLGGLFTSPWGKHQWIINGQPYTLDNIEHDIIRPLGEARIHFAVNCAAKSCPDLRREAYRPGNLDAQLADQVTLTFLNATKGFRRVPDQDTVYVSKVMDWFDEDFNDGDVQSWLKPYYPKIVNDQTDIRFFDYDWSLNKL